MAATTLLWAIICVLSSEARRLHVKGHRGATIAAGDLDA